MGDSSTTIKKTPVVNPRGKNLLRTVLPVNETWPKKTQLISFAGHLRKCIGRKMHVYITDRFFNFFLHHSLCDVILRLLNTINVFQKKKKKKKKKKSTCVDTTA